MTRARLATGAAAVMAFFVLMPAAPASADANVTVHIASPTDGFVVTSGSSVQVNGNAAIDSGGLGTNEITGVNVEVTGPVSRSCTGCGFSYVQGKPTTSFSFRADLSTNGPYAYNGHYTATVNVTATEYLALNLGGTPRSGSATRSFKVGVAPVTPTVLGAVVNGDRTVTVTWRANPEPDIIGYRVQGSDGSKSGVFEPTATLAWKDTATTQTGGKYSYVVLVARAGADGPTGTPIFASAAFGVDVPAPPPPTTTSDGSLPPLVQPSPTSLGGTGAGGSGSAVPTLDLSGFLPKTAPPAKLTAPAPKLVTPGEQIAPDTGFQPTLPFPVTAGRNGQGGKGAAGTPGALGAQSAGSSHSTKRTVLLPFAAGLFLCVVGIHVRWFNKRFGGDGTDPSLLPVEDVPAGGSDILPAPAPVVARPVRVGATAKGAHRPAGDDLAPTPLDDENVLVTW